jgi:divalent metal cation (Fe/Co/Zn/Cd) transporter
VVILGLLFVWAGKYFKIPILSFADPIAALGVCVVVIKVSIKLGKETIDVLLDTAPDGMREIVENEAGSVSGVLEITDIRIRPSGPTHFVHVDVGVDRNLAHKAVHEVVREIKRRVNLKIPRSDVVVSTFPVDIVTVSDKGIYSTIQGIIDQLPNCNNIHNINIYDIGDKKTIAAHIELTENLTLKESHDLSHRISNMIQDELPEIATVNIFFECTEYKVISEDITEFNPDLIAKIRNVVSDMGLNMSCHNIQLFSEAEKISAFLHCVMNENITVEELESVSSRIDQEMKSKIEELESVHIHFEPKDVEE